MDNLFQSLSERLEATTSRRGFLGTAAKVAAGIAAAAAGIAAGVGIANASPVCCTSYGAKYPNGCPGGVVCPSGSSIKYRWTCCMSHSLYACGDCYQGNTFICVAWENLRVSC